MTGFRVRRLTLGALILGGGTLMALPFRRPAVPDPPAVDSPHNQSRSALFDDESLELLVQEVTADVKVPVVYHPHTDYTPASPPMQTRRLPLSYEDLAVPVDRDPIYESRFNATASVASNAPPGNQSRRIVELERKFAKTTFTDEAIASLPTGDMVPRAIPGEGKQWVFQENADAANLLDGPSQQRRSPGAQLASSETMPKRSTGDNSILKQLPPPDDATNAGNPDRPRQWIQQPD